MKKQIALVLVLFGLMAASPQKATAQFAVFDVATWSELGTIWAEDVSTGVKIAQTVVQGTQIIQNGLSIYNLALRETNALRNKQFMQAAGYLSNLNIPGHADWTMALKSPAGPIAAAGAWQAMTNPRTSLANRIQLADAFGTSTADALGGCNAAAATNDNAIGQLEQVALSMATLDNTRASQGGLSNMSSTQSLRIQQCQQNLQQQQAQLQMHQLMVQREQDNAQQTLYQQIDAISTANPRGITNLSAMSLADFN